MYNLEINAPLSQTNLFYFLAPYALSTLIFTKSAAEIGLYLAGRSAETQVEIAYMLRVRVQMRGSMEVGEERD